MKRREFISLMSVAVGWPLAVRAQQPALPVIGFLNSRSSDVDASFLTAFHKGLAETGFVEGHNVTIEYRWAKGRYDQLPAMAAELVRKSVAVLVSTGGTVAAKAAKAVTRTIPVVFTTADDPVKVGLVDSLSRPGGNLTGITALFIEAASKRLELLHELLPRASTIGLLVNPTNPATLIESSVVQSAARGHRVEILSVSTDRAFEDLKQKQVDALLIAADPFLFARADQLVALAARQAIPTLYFRSEFAQAGGLISFGSNFADFFRVIGLYAGQILRGAKPSGLPVQQPTKFELVINLKTAKALGLTVPPSLLSQADEVIE
ncbi:ABC transporter substrate-binding protein [Microvirga soli]|jgi:putative ABC transport system substrate-binding protein|uniref:ABC transporter substrate-binding protein n=1 Tax=Microvirga soli TaxID=1854496 RepID=UPI00191EDBB3|nr:ABC transporter substrate-binding protein [Microvirga soli]